MENKAKTIDLSSMTRAELEQNIVDLTTKLEEQNAKIAWLEEQFRRYQKQRFGSSSEKGMADGEQICLFNESEWTVDEAEKDGEEIEEPDMSKVAPPKKTRTKGGKNRMTSGLPKQTIDFRLSPEEMTCPNCGSELTEVKTTVRKEIVVVPAKVSVKEYIDAVYTCRNCQKTGEFNPMHTGHSPKPLLRNSLASPSFVAYIITQKFVAGVPIYRLESDLHRNGVKLNRQVMSSWHLRCTEKYLRGVYEILQEELLKRDIIQADETTLQVLHEKDKPPTSDSYMWLYQTSPWDGDHQIILYEYQDNRRQENPANFLKGFSGYLQTDGYSGYNSVTKREKDPCTSVMCWGHARRYFCDALSGLNEDEKESFEGPCKKAIAYADKIFAADRDLGNLSAEERTAARLEKATAVMDEYFKWINTFDREKLRKSKFREGIVYSQNHEAQLRAYLQDGRIQCSNNAAERSIKPFVIARKNFLFCNTPSGADAAAISFSLTETAKANGLNPFKYLEYIFEKLSQDEDYDLEQLMPWIDEVVTACKADPTEE